MKNVFDQQVTNELIGRINQLNTSSQAQWGKMNIAQMLAHCNVTYELIYTDNQPKTGAFMKFFLKLFVKSTVVGEKPYSQNGRTAPAFIITGEKEFEKEKKRLIGYMKQTQELGESHFHNKESHSFGSLTKTEWSNMFYKHLDHHLNQFGA